MRIKRAVLQPPDQANSPADTVAMPGKKLELELICYNFRKPGVPEKIHAEGRKMRLGQWQANRRGPVWTMADP